MDSIYDDKIRMLAELKQERQPYEDHYKLLQEYFLPRRGRYIEMPKDAQGKRMNGKLVDPTPKFCARTLSSGMHAGSTNPATPWFKLQTPDPEMMESAGISRWLYTVEQLMYAAFERSNVYSVLPMVYLDSGVFGTSPMTILEHSDRIIHCVPAPIGSYYLFTDADGGVIGKYCEYQWTAMQMVNYFGINAVSEQVKRALEAQTSQASFKVLHAIEPNGTRKYGVYDNKNMAWRSVYVEIGSPDKRILKQSGFEDNPLGTLRWETTEITDAYGSSCGMDALGCARAMQVQQRRKAQAIDKVIDPPMVGDPGLQEQPSSILSGGVTWAGFTANGSAPKFQPAYQIKPEIQALLEDIQDVRQLVKEAMYTDLFLAITMADPRNATAEEIIERREEKILMLGPVLQNHKDGLVKPLIDRTFNIMMRQGRLPPPPPELEGQDLKVEMVGVLAQALKAVKTGSIQQFLGFIGAMGKAQYEATGTPGDIMDKIDMDQAADEMAMAAGVPPTIVRDDNAVAQIRSDRAQQQAAQQQAAAAQPTKDAAMAAKAASETKLGTGSALDAVLGS